MPLNDLSLDELTEIAGTLDHIRDAGATLAAYGLNPTFNLTPGQPATITLPFEMPEAPARSIFLSEGPATAEAIDAAMNSYGTTETLAEVLERLDQNDAENFADHEMTKRRLRDLEHCVADLALTAEANGLHLLPTPSTEAAQPEPAPEPVEPPAVEGQAGGTLSAEASRSGGEADPPPAVAEVSPPPMAEAAPPGAEAERGGGGDVAAAPDAPAAPETAPGAQPGAATQDKMLPATWTAEEDDRLIEIVVGRVQIGETKKAAIARAASELGRPEAGTAFRCHHKLKPRIDAALTAAAMHQAQTEPAPEIPASPAPAIATDGSTASDGDAAVGGDTPAAVQDEPDMEPDQRAAETTVRAAASIEGQKAEASTSFLADPVTAYLMALTDKGGWTVERDHELMELSIAGWQTSEIALLLKMQANAIKPRFDTLTGLHEDPATGKKARRFTREEVFAALSRLVGKAA